MLIGVPREIHQHEHRVGLTPFGVSRLVQQGHTVYVEHRSGEAAHFTDRHYEKAGAQLVYNPEEAYKRADLVCRVGVLAPEEIHLLRSEQVICGFHHLAVAPREHVERLIEMKATLIGYEIIRDADGDLPVLHPFSEMAGQTAVHLAAHYLQIEPGGRGVVMGNVPGVPPPTVLILGAGTVGRTAARLALANGAHVIVLDADVRKLRTVNDELGPQVVTVMATLERLARYTRIADVVIGAVLIPGERAPFLVTEPMVRAMKPGSVIIDVSIDQGGCVETSRPTTPDQPTFVVHDVVHFCVPNMTANVARTASRALANAALPLIVELAGRGLDPALRENPGLAEGVFLYRGKLVSRRVGEAFGIPTTTLQEAMSEGGNR